MNQTDGILDDSQSDRNKNGTSSAKSGCKLRPDEGLDAISSLAPGSLSSELLVGGTNTVYAWLTQWLADNLGYDVGSIVGLPYDWRLSPDVMEDRDGFLTLTRRRLEAAVKSNGLPGIMVAHSMGNVIFRYFLEWLRNEMREEAYARYVKRAERRAATAVQQSTGTAAAVASAQETTTETSSNGGGSGSSTSSSTLPGWMGGVPPHKVDFDSIADFIQSSGDGGDIERPGVFGQGDAKIGDRMHTFANSVVAGIDDLLRTYFPNPSDTKNRRDKEGSNDPIVPPFPSRPSSMSSDYSSNTEKQPEGENGRRPEQNSKDQHQQHQHRHQQQAGGSINNGDDKNGRHAPLWELAQMEGDANWIEWINDHIWTYVGLSAPLLGAVNPLRAVLSGENMGLPITDEVARGLELSFGSTHTVNPISTKMGFCDNENAFDSFGKNETASSTANDMEQIRINRANLACLDELVSGIEESRKGNPLSQEDPWKGYNALRLLLKERIDWDSDFPMIQVSKEQCQKSEKARPCAVREELNFGPQDVQNGALFTNFHEIWNEENDPLLIKREQLETSFWNTPFQNILRTTWDRPHIKHVIMAYGVDVPTEVGYVYRKEEEYEEGGEASSFPSDSTADDENGDSPVKSDTESDASTAESSKNGNRSRKTDTKITEKRYDGTPGLHKIIWEEAHGKLMEVPTVTKPTSLTESLYKKKKPKKQALNGGDGNGKLHHSGDGTIPYLSLSWAHTWLLHATRAMRHSGHATKEGERISDDNALDSILITHRPKGGSEWIKGYAKNRGKDGEDGANGKGSSDSNPADDDTGTRHPHGTKYKPEMHRYQSEGKSRSTGMEYTTTVIEAIGVEHKETTRNYDILAAVFTDVLNYMHDDFGLV
uniref:Phospholipid:diacylglycerol acyltransferase n=1 Tax=Ditylum brightwellii TaxID=49249 RepID=A0A7S4RMJ9_9STRA